MKFKEILKRITGISTPVFGISWNPDNTERDLAQEIISHLEDRRVLYNPSIVESPHHCVESVLQIREFLTSKIGKMDQGSELTKSLRAMRAACRKFLDRSGYNEGPFLIRLGDHMGRSWDFITAVGELRGVFGIHLAKIAVAYGIDVEEDLASIIPDLDIDYNSLQDANTKIINSPS